MLSTEVTEVVVPGVQGYLGVWAGHAPLLTAMQVGLVHIRFPDGTREHVAVSGGFLEVSPERVTILAETAERAGEIDRSRAEAALRRAEDRLRGSDFPEVDPERVRLALARAMNRLRALEEE